MADLVTRLLLYTNNFDSNIEKSSRRLAGFKQTGTNVSNAFSKLGGTVMKFAGTLGVATTAGEALKTMFTHNDKMADVYKRTMEQAKTVTTSFFTSLSQGNLSSFFSNFDRITASARDAYNALDELNTFKTGTTVEMSNLNAAYQIQLNLAKDRTLAEKERLVHLENARNILKEQSQQMLLQLKMTKLSYQTAFRQSMNEYGGVGNPLKQDYARGLFEHWTKTGPAVQNFVNTYESSVKRLKGIMEENSEIVGEGIDSYRQYNPTGVAAEKALKELQTKWGEEYTIGTGLINMLNNPDDKVLAMMNLAKDANSLEVQLSNLELELNRTESRIIGTGGHTTTKTTPQKVVYDQGTEGWFEQKIQEAQAKLKNASAEERVKLEGEIAGYKMEIEALKFNARIIGLKEIEKQLAEKGIAMPGQNLSVTKSPKMDVYMTAKTNKDLADKFAELKANPVPVNNGAGGDKWEKTIEAINATASALNVLNEEFDKSVAGILKWASTLLTASAQAVKAIIAVTAAKSAESAAETPVIGWMLAAGAAASVLAALTALCSFAQGGIVPGSEYSGDRVLARVNSGEMILNRAQQANLFKMLNNGRGGEVGSNFGGRVVFEIRGDQLRGVLDNHDNRSRKIS